MNAQEILQEIKGATIVVPWALEALLRICRMVQDLPGSVAECGVYHGGTLRLLARALPRKTIWGFDTFTGIPPSMTQAFDTNFAGEFGDTSFNQVADYIKDLGNVCLIPGVFPETFLQVPRGENFCLVHLDCDQYDSYHAALAFFLPRLVDKGIMVFDDYTHCEGARRAVDERFPWLEKPPYAVQLQDGVLQTVEKRLA